MAKIKKILSKVLEIKESSITDKTSPDNVPSWDSFNSLMLVSEIESEFRVKFSIQETVSIKNVKDIANAAAKA